MQLTQLNPSIPVIVTSKDNRKGDAIAWLDYSTEHYIIWGVALENGEVWWVPNHEIRLQNNWTMGRRAKPEEYQSNIDKLNSKQKDINKSILHLPLNTPAQ